MEQAAGAIDAVPTFGQMGLDGGKTAKMLAEGLDVNKNGYNMFGLRYSRFLRGAAALGAITSGAVISSAVEDVERSESGAQGAAGQHDGGDKRYIPRNWYEGSWIMTATQAGVIDSAIDMGMVTGEMVWNVGKVLTLGVASDLSKLKIWGPSAQAYLDAKAGKYGQVRDTLEDYSEETWEFIKNYVGNPAFKAAFDNEMSAMLTDYGKSLWGLDKEAGYQRGRLIGDLLLLFFSAGKVGKLLGNWKRLRRFNIKELLPGVGKTLPKTPAPKSLPPLKSIETTPAERAIESAAEKLKTANHPAPSIIKTETTTLGSSEEISSMVGKAEKHVFQAELPKLDKSTGTFKYKGAHTKSALEQMAKENNGSYILKDLKINPETGVYQCRPVLTFENGIVTSRRGNNGICTFFPDTWSPQRIKEEVIHASKNIIGKDKFRRNVYIGLSKDGKIKIAIQYDEYIDKKGNVVKKITSYYPLYE